MATFLESATQTTPPMEHFLSTQNKTQLEKFKEAARQLETDDDEARFDEKLKRIAKAKPDEKAEPAKK